MWRKSENSDSVKPEEFEINVDTVYFRRNYKLVEETEDKPAHWEYEERAISKVAYDNYMAQKELETLIP